MNKIKVEIYKDVLRDISANFDGGKEVIKQRTEEKCDRKMSVEKVVYCFCLWRVVLLVLEYAVNLPVELKIVVSYIIKESAKLRKKELAYQKTYILWCQNLRVDLVLFTKMFS